MDCALNHSGSGFKRCGFGNRFYWFGVNESRFVFKFISFQKYPGKVERNWMSYHDPRAARRQFCVSKLKAITSSWPLKRELHMNPKTKNNFFTRIGLLFTRNQWIRSPKPHLFETALQSGLNSRSHQSGWKIYGFQNRPGSCGQGPKTKKLSLALEAAIWV